MEVNRSGGRNKDTEMKRIIVKKNRYVDSVTLTSVGDKILKLEGWKMRSTNGQWANQKLLTELGIKYQRTGPDDLVMAVTGDSEEHLDAALSRIEDILEHRFEKERGALEQFGGSATEEISS